MLLSRAQLSTLRFNRKRSNYKMYYGKCWTAMNKGLARGIVTMGLAASSFGAGQETVLHTFANGSDGSLPFSGLTIDAKGNLYGTTDLGGSPEFGDGTVFQLRPKTSGGFDLPNHSRFFASKGRRW